MTHPTISGETDWANLTEAHLRTLVADTPGLLQLAEEKGLTETVTLWHLAQVTNISIRSLAKAAHMPEQIAA